MSDKEKDYIETDENLEDLVDETNDADNGKEWEFDGVAHTLEDELTLDDNFTIEVKSDDKSEENDDEKPDDFKEQGIDNSTDSNMPKFIMAAIGIAVIAFILIFLGKVYYTQPNASGETNPGNVCMTIGKTPITVGMYNYCYTGTVNRVLQSRQEISFEIPFNEQTILDDDNNEITVEEYFKQRTIDYLKSLIYFYEQGIKEGITLTTQQQADVDEELSKTREEAHKAGIGIDEYCQKKFGEYCGLEVYKSFLEYQIIASEYSNRLFVGIDKISLDEIETHFQDNIQDYQDTKVGYLALPFDTKTEGSKEQAIADAQKYVESVKDLDSFEALIPVVYSDMIEQAIAGEDSPYKTEKDAIDALKQIVEVSIAKNSKSFGMIDAYSVDIGSWAFDSNTAVGTATYFVDDEYSTVYIVYKMEEPKVDERLYEDTYAVRHILVTPKHSNEDAKGNDEFTQEEWDEAKTQAQDIYDKYKNGDGSEVSFALLAEEYTDDVASTSKAPGGSSYGGIFADLFMMDNQLCSSGANGKVYGVVDGFSDWVIDPNRAYGDTGIVETKFGYHIMFYIYKEPYYVTLIRNEMIFNDAQAKIDACSVRENKSTMKKAKVITLADLTSAS